MDRRVKLFLVQDVGTPPCAPVLDTSDNDGPMGAAHKLFYGRRPQGHFLPSTRESACYIAIIISNRAPLFLIYLNYLLYIKIKGYIISYADDTILVFNASSWTEVHESANKACNL